MRKLFEGFPYSAGQAQFAPQDSDTKYAAVLSANTAKRYAIPTDAVYVVLSGTADFYDKYGDNTVTAAVPTVDITDGSASELNQGARRIPSGATYISLVSGSACIVTMAFYS